MGTGQIITLFLCLFLAFAFEFVNGFHDTANAVATVIYTRTMPPKIAVAWSGFFNFLGVFFGGLAVAIGIINLLPTEVIAGSSQSLALSMILALLLSAIIWNLGTWYFGIPASSSHTLIGSILGVGLAYSFLPGHSFGQGVNWSKASDIGLALFLSPLVGFGLAALLLLLMKRLFPQKKLYQDATVAGKPPFLVRAILTLTCSGVSFAHGSNDGQKGIGLVMLILIAIMPGRFALNPNITTQQIQDARRAIAKIETSVQTQSVVANPRSSGLSLMGQAYAGENIAQNENREFLIHAKNIRRALAKGSIENNVALRSDIFALEAQMNRFLKNGYFPSTEAAQVKSQVAQLRKLTDYAPLWVLICVATTLGLGTMIGWKRIVVTVGTKIGKEHLSYSQGMAAEIVAMSTIGLAGFAGLPVSTTHVLSSGIAGTMVAQKAGVQLKTVEKIGLAWVLTLPATMVISGVLFFVMRAIFQA